MPNCNIAKFCPKLEDWDDYREYFENEFKKHRVCPASIKRLLLSSLDKKVLDQLNKFCYPGSVHSKSYDELCILLSLLYYPQKCIEKERKIFMAMGREESECLTTWMNRIKRQAVLCGFADEREKLMLRKFTTGLGEDLRRRISAKGALINLRQAWKMAVESECEEIVKVVKGSTCDLGRKYGCKTVTKFETGCTCHSCDMEAYYELLHPTQAPPKHIFEDADLL
jgi:hypothetical protein